MMYLQNIQTVDVLRLIITLIILLGFYPLLCLVKLNIQEIIQARKANSVQIALITILLGFLISDILTMLIYVVAYTDGLDQLAQLHIANVRNLMKNIAITSFLWIFYKISREHK